MNYSYGPTVVKARAATHATPDGRPRVPAAARAQGDGLRVHVARRRRPACNIPECIDTRVDMCIGMRIGMCIGMRMRIAGHVYVASSFFPAVCCCEFECIDVFIDTCVGAHMDMCM